MAHRYAEGIKKTDADGLFVAALLLGVDMPNNVVGEAVDAVTRTLGHLGKTFGLGLVLEGVAGEVDPWSV
jgi:hypothetical protein